MSKVCTIPIEDIEYIVNKVATPVQIYDGNKIIETIKKFNHAFFSNKRQFFKNSGFRQYFAVKATPNPEILRLMYRHKCGFDCSSLAEVKLVLEYIPEIMDDTENCKIIYTSNYTSCDDIIELLKLKDYIFFNFDDIDGFINMKTVCKNNEQFPIDHVTFRYNPEFGKTDSETKSNILGGTGSKFGMSKKRLFDAYTLAQKEGIVDFGIHVMTGSCVMNPDFWIDIINDICQVIKELKNKLNIVLDFIDIGGGFGIPYRPEDKELDINLVAKNIYQTFYDNLKNTDLEMPGLLTESGRYITGPSGYLITKCQSIKEDFNQKFYGVDATMANLMRPGMYNSYHHITVPENEYSDCEREEVNVVGTLCENNDWFCKARMLPKGIKKNDLFIIHDTGAHGHSMGFQYNGKMKAPEILYMGKNDKKKIIQIRNRDTYKSYVSKYTVKEL